MKNFDFSNKLSDVPVIGGAFSTSNADTIPFSFGYPHPSTFPIEELYKATEEALFASGDAALQYTGGSGKSRLIDWIKTRAEGSHIDVSVDNVLVTSGSGQAIDLITRALTDPGDTIWMEAPTFFGALRYFRLAEVDIESFPLDEHGIRVDLVEAELQKARENNTPIPKFLYVISNHHNPKGVSLSVDRRKKLAELAYEYNFFIIEDDAYGELHFEHKKTPSIFSFGPERVIYTSSFSKIFGPGLRLGWAIASAEVLNHMRTLKSEGSTSVFIQEIIANMLETFDFDAHVEHLRQFYKKRRDLMIDAIQHYFNDSVTFNVPLGGFFIWLTFPEHVDTTSLLQQAKDTYNVDFFASQQFYGAEKEHNHIRLSFSYCTEEQIAEGIASIAKTYDALDE